MRCNHLLRNGWQCTESAVAGSDFCAAHRPVMEILEPEWPEPKPIPLIYRLAALLLLLLFALQAYQTVSAWLAG